jgi:hypothetical protein
LNPEEQIRSRLREIARETRKVRQELEEMIWRTPERTRVVSDDLGPKLRRRKRR